MTKTFIKNPIKRTHNISTLKEHQSFLSKTTVSKVSDSVPQSISMKENIFNCVPKSGKCVTKIKLD